MSRSTESRPTAGGPTIAPTTGRERADVQSAPGEAAVPTPEGAATGPKPTGAAIRVTLAPEHGPAPVMTVESGRASIDGQSIPAELRWVAGDRARLQPQGVEVQFLEPADVARVPPGVTRREVLVEGWRLVVEMEPAARAELRERASRADRAGIRRVASEMHAMIPGRVLSIAVAVGDAVEAGQAVMIIEAMKMQNALRVPRAGIVGRVAVAPGGTVELGDLLIALEPPPAQPAGEAAS